MPLSAEMNNLRQEVNEHDKRIRDLEIAQAKVYGAMLALSFVGSALGSLLMLAINHYWK